MVFKYTMSGGFLGSFDPSNENKNGRGIATDGTTIWIVDKSDRAVYQYDLAGNSLGQFDLKTSNKDPEGITRTAKSFWVVDHDQDRLYSYDLSGCSTGEVSLAAANSDPKGVTTDGSSFWVVDENDRRVYVYDANGDYIDDFALHSSNADASGITTNGQLIWVVDKNDETIYKYDMSGTFIEAISIASANSDARGIAVHDSTLFVVDRQDDKVYKYDFAGNSLGTLDLSDRNDKPTGITTDGIKFWASDGGGDDDSDDDSNDTREVVFEYGIDGSYLSALPMDRFAPTAPTLYNYDTNRDKRVGLELERTHKGVSETKRDKYQAWRTGPLPDGSVITGDVYVTFYAAIEKFKQDKEGKVDVFLRDYDGQGGYVEISRGTSVSNDWQDGSETFIEKTIVMAAVDYVVPAGHELELRFVVRKPSSDEMWFAYDTELYPASLKITREYRVGGTPFYLRNVPSPPFSDTYSPGIAGKLTSSNGDRRGIALLPGTGNSPRFLVVDRSDRQVYRYDSAGNFIGTFDLVSGNADARGITTDGSSIWIVDGSDDEVYEYSLTGASIGGFNLTPDNKDGTGIATDGSSVWIVDADDRRVYEYTTSGALAGSFPLDSSNSNARGIATDGSTIWVVDRSDDEVYKYDVNGPSLGGFDLESGNKDPEGITTDGVNIWVVDDDKNIYTYYALDGSYRTWLDMDGAPPPGGSVLFNYDVDRDNNPGLEVERSSKGFDETDPDEHQAWRTEPFAEDFVISEDSAIDFWAALNHFHDNDGGSHDDGSSDDDNSHDDDGEVTVYLRDLDPDAGTYVEIGSGTVFDPDWHDEAPGTFAKRNITIADLDYTIPAGHQLEVKFVVDEDSHKEMWFAYDTEEYPAVVIPSVEKALGSGAGAIIEFINGAALPRQFPISFNEAYYQGLVTACADLESLVEIMCDFGGDVSLKAVKGVWTDQARTRLKPGIYYTQGELILDASGVVAEGVTLVARSIKITGTDSRLTPHSQGLGVVLFATGADEDGVGLELAGSDHNILGIIYAPLSDVVLKASRIFIDGSIYCDGFFWLGSVGRISFTQELLE